MLLPKSKKFTFDLLHNSQPQWGSSWEDHQEEISITINILNERTSWLKILRNKVFSVWFTNNCIFIFEKKLGNFEETVSLYQSVLHNHAKENSLLSRAFLRKIQLVVKWLSNQISNFRIETHQSLLISRQLKFTLHYKIHSVLTHGIFNSEVSSKISCHLRVMKSQLFSNI